MEQVCSGICEIGATNDDKVGVMMTFDLILYCYKNPEIQHSHL